MCKIKKVLLILYQKISENNKIPLITIFIKINIFEYLLAYIIILLIELIAKITH